jgi:hypothetical protein
VVVQGRQARRGRRSIHTESPKAAAPAPLSRHGIRECRFVGDYKIGFIRNRQRRRQDPLAIPDRRAELERPQSSGSSSKSSESKSRAQQKALSEGRVAKGTKSQKTSCDFVPFCGSDRIPRQLSIHQPPDTQRIPHSLLIRQTKIRKSLVADLPREPVYRASPY